MIGGSRPPHAMKLGLIPRQFAGRRFCMVVAGAVPNE